MRDQALCMLIRTTSAIFLNQPGQLCQRIYDVISVMLAEAAYEIDGT